MKKFDVTHAPTLLAPMLRDAQAMRDASFASAADIDTAMKLGAGHPAGPFEYAATLTPAELAAIGHIGEPQERTEVHTADALDAWAGPIGVVGTGQMASGIVECIATSGTSVIVLSRSVASSERVRSIMGRSLERAQSKARITAEDAAAALAAVTFTSDVNDLAATQLVIEAVAENLDLKHEIMGQLDAVLRRDAVIATNTSSFRIAELRGDIASEREVIALHFFNPAPAMRLLEIVTPTPSSPTASSALAFARTIGKTAVTCRDERGFIVNRLLIPYLNDAVACIDGGAEPTAVDDAVKAQVGHPMGPLALIDLIGVDVTIATLTSLHEATGDPRMTPRPALTTLLAAGHLGRKSGRGFYTYDR